MCFHFGSSTSSINIVNKHHVELFGNPNKDTIVMCLLHVKDILWPWICSAVAKSCEGQRTTYECQLFFFFLSFCLLNISTGISNRHSRLSTSSPSSANPVHSAALFSVDVALESALAVCSDLIYSVWANSIGCIFKLKSEFHHLSKPPPLFF